MLLFESYYDNNLVSLNKPVGEDEDSDSCLMDFIETTEAIPEIVVEKRQLQEDVRNAMHEALSKYNSFNQREIDVINLRFGIYDNQPRTLQEVAEIFGVTRERIRQIEAKVIKKLRRSATFKNKTKNYVDSEY